VGRRELSLGDISSFVDRLRGEHRRTADAEHAWQGLKDTWRAPRDNPPPPRHLGLKVIGPGSRPRASCRQARISVSAICVFSATPARLPGS